MRKASPLPPMPGPPPSSGQMRMMLPGFPAPPAPRLRKAARIPAAASLKHANSLICDPPYDGGADDSGAPQGQQPPSRAKVKGEAHRVLELAQASGAQSEESARPPRLLSGRAAIVSWNKQNSGSKNVISNRRARPFRQSLERIFDAVLHRAAERREAQDRPRRGGVSRRAPQRPRAESAAHAR